MFDTDCDDEVRTTRRVRTKYEIDDDCDEIIDDDCGSDSGCIRDGVCDDVAGNIDEIDIAVHWNPDGTWSNSGLGLKSVMVPRITRHASQAPVANVLLNGLLQVRSEVLLGTIRGVPGRTPQPVQAH